VWVEVPFEDYGWVPIDVLPDPNNRVAPQPQSNEVPKPPVLEDPQAPEEPPQAQLEDIENPQDDPVEATPFDWRIVGVFALGIGLPLLLILTPILLVLGRKARRRRRRRSTPDVVIRMADGWREVVDVATDLRVPVPAGMTRSQGAAHLADALPGADGAAVSRIAAEADVVVFAPVTPTPQEAAELWREVDRLTRGLGKGLPLRRRVAGRLSTRSFRAARAARSRGARRGVFARMSSRMSGRMSVPGGRR
jgi:hypothetical protein